MVAGTGDPPIASRPTERAEDCTSRIIAGAGSGFATGAIMGAITANWSDVPLVLRNQPWPALKRTGGCIPVAPWQPPRARKGGGEERARGQSHTV